MTKKLAGLPHPEEMLAQAIQFIIESEKLKSVERQTSPVDLSRRENSAEHSWTLALAATVLIPAVAPDLDQLRILQMLIIHDLVEIDAGDTFCYGDQTGKAEREQKSAERLFGILSKDTRESFHKLWNEFEDNKTPEAQFANCLDRLMPLIQNYQNKGGSWTRHGVTYEQVYDRNRQIQNGPPELWKYTESLIEAAVEEGLLPRNSQTSPDEV
ncbi:HD domain-containing protein [Akkermansiaceae bacterium]|nr:HD domain-containing protein [Akkermansiaceae bacterium]